MTGRPVEITNTVAMDVGTECTLGDLRTFLDKVATAPNTVAVKFKITRGYSDFRESSPDTVKVVVDLAART